MHKAFRRSLRTYVNTYCTCKSLLSLEVNIPVIIETTLGLCAGSLWLKAEKKKGNEEESSRLGNAGAARPGPGHSRAPQGTHTAPPERPPSFQHHFCVFNRITDTTRAGMLPAGQSAAREPPANGRAGWLSRGGAVWCWRLSRKGLYNLKTGLPGEEKGVGG